jgi:hypothetical protein
LNVKLFLWRYRCVKNAPKNQDVSVLAVGGISITTRALHIPIKYLLQFILQFVGKVVFLRCKI